VAPGDLPGGALATVDLLVSSEFNTVQIYQNPLEVTSTQDTTGLELTLTESSAASGGQFTATVTLSDSPISTSSLTLFTLGGDTITAQYTDVTPVAGSFISVSDAALVETTPPALTVLTPLDNSKTQSRKPTFSVEITDNESGVDQDTILFNIVSNVASGNGVGSFAADDITTSGGVTTAEFKIPANLLNSADSPQETLVSWNVSVSDLSGNSGQTDSDTGTPGNQDHSVILDRIAPNITSGETGTWWDASKQGSDKTTISPDHADSVIIVFDEPLDLSSIAESDFTVNGLTPIVAIAYVGRPSAVFLTMATDLASSSNPDVSVVSMIADVAGNTSSVDYVKAVDGITPVFGATLSAPTTNDSVVLAITSDEALNSGQPTVTMTEPGGADNAISISVTAGGSANTWNATIDVQDEGLDDGDQAIKIVGFDNAGNQAVYGGTDPTAAGYPAELALNVDTAFSAPTFNPTGPPVSFTYAEPVTVTAATFDGSDVLGDLVSSDQMTFELQEPGLPPGNYQIVVSAADAVGNTSLGDNASVEIIGVPVSGTVSLQLQSTIPQIATGNSIATVRLFIDGASTSMQATDVAANGSFTFIGIPEGTYDIVAEAFGALSARLEDVIVGGTPVNVASTTLPIGDINDDGSVTIQDLSGAASNFGTSGPVAWGP